jgi:hypothetical protein
MVRVHSLSGGGAAFVREGGVDPGEGVLRVARCERQRAASTEAVEVVGRQQYERALMDPEMPDLCP